MKIRKIFKITADYRPKGYSPHPIYHIIAKDLKSAKKDFSTSFPHLKIYDAEYIRDVDMSTVPQGMYDLDVDFVYGNLGYEKCW